MQNSVQRDYIFIDSDDELELNELPFRVKNKTSQNLCDAQNPIETLDFDEVPKWYSITVDDPGRHSKNEIFDGILKSISPFEFIPVLQEKGAIVKKFYVTKCERAIKKISHSGFNFFCLNDVNPFRIKIIHNDPPLKKVNPFKIVHDVILQRFNLGNNMLDLSNFMENFDMQDILYFPLWYPGNQKVVKLLIKSLSLAPYIHTLNLSDNALRDITALDIPTCFNMVTKLNLSNNLIGSLSALNYLRGHAANITNLALDGNDLCLNFVQEQHYVDCVNSIFPSLNILDGKVFKFDGFPVPQKNFNVDQTSLLLVNKFMEIYFTLFDSDERDLLTEMYCPKALFNIACHVTHASNFHKRSRNLLHIKGKGNVGNVYVGPRSIIGCLGYLPKTDHDPLTFTVDVPLHTHVSTMVIITGVFKLPSTVLSQDEPLYEFMRTFILVKGVDNSYKIANDCLNISSHLSSRAANAFATTLVSSEKLTLNLDPAVLLPSQKEEMIDVFTSLTQVSYPAADEYLERNRWNFRTALLDFIDGMKNSNY